MEIALYNRRFLTTFFISLGFLLAVFLLPHSCLLPSPSHAFEAGRLAAASRLLPVRGRRAWASTGPSGPGSGAAPARPPQPNRPFLAFSSSGTESEHKEESNDVRESDGDRRKEEGEGDERACVGAAAVVEWGSSLVHSSATTAPDRLGGGAPNTDPGPLSQETAEDTERTHFFCLSRRGQRLKSVLDAANLPRPGPPRPSFLR